jgi:uncharacterized membrane protein
VNVKDILLNIFPPPRRSFASSTFEDATASTLFKPSDYWPYIFGAFLFGGIIATPLLANWLAPLPMPAAFRFERILPWTIFCAWIFCQGHRKGGSPYFAWYGVWAFIYGVVLAIVFLISGTSAFMSTLLWGLYCVVIGFPLMFAGGVIGIIIGRATPASFRIIAPLFAFLICFGVVWALLEFPHHMTFTAPTWFALLLLTPWFWWMHRAVTTGLSADRALTALLIRLCLFGLFVMVMAEPRSVTKSDALSIVFVLDHSRSISNQQTDDGMTTISKFVSAKPGEDKAGLIIFGRNGVVELPPTLAFPKGDEFEMTLGVDREGTNIAKALSLGAAMLPEESIGRLVLLSDGVATEGSLSTVLEELKSRGVAVDVLEMPYVHEHEVVVERLELPRMSKTGDTYDAAVIVSSLSDGEGTLTLQENGEPIFRGKVKYKAGKNRFVIPIQQVREAGRYEYTARLEPPEGKDGFSQNNKAISYLLMKGKGKILVVADLDGDERDWEMMVKALRESEREVDIQDSFEFPDDPLALLPYDCVIFVNVAKDQFIDPQLLALKNAVVNQGSGFLMVGGENSFGPGGYNGTVVEDILPVDLDVSQKKALPKGALAIVLHTCEFPQGNKWAKDITKAAMKVLNARDEVGVLAFDYSGGDKWLFKLQEARNYPKLIRVINSAQIGDMPTFGNTMQLAYNGLFKSDASAKHLIIISDGDPSPPTPSLLASFIKAKISVTTVEVFPHIGGNIGPNTVTTMKQIAKATGGRHFFLYKPGDEKRLPAIFIKEARRLKRSMIQNKKFTPEVNHPSDVLKGIDSLPPLYGYVLTTPKGGRTYPMILKVPGAEDDEPILALGKFGIGQTAAFTADLSVGWGKDWVQWSKYKAFVKQLTSHISRKSKQGFLRMQTYASGETGIVTIEDYAPDAGFLTVQSIIDGPGDEDQIVELKQVGSRRYEGRFKIGGEGRYIVQAIGMGVDRKERLHGGFVVPYSQEFTRFQSNPLTLLQIANKTAGPGGAPGRVLDMNMTGEELFDVDRVAKSSSNPIFPWFLWALALLVPLDVAVRRVQIDMATVAGWFGRGVTHKPSDEMFSQLLKTKRTMEAALSRSAQGAQGTGKAKEDIPSVIPMGNTVDLEQLRLQRADELKRKAAKEAQAQQPQAQQGEYQSTTERLLAAKRKAKEEQDENNEEAS